LYTIEEFSTIEEFCRKKILEAEAIERHHQKRSQQGIKSQFFIGLIMNDYRIHVSYKQQLFGTGQ